MFAGLECDISFNNILALRNTTLLSLYSQLDDRVRILAYIIKFWAKQRHMNSPGEGTLGSYGYILCLLQFLQTRNPPVIVNLQQIPEIIHNSNDQNNNSNSSMTFLPKRWEKHPVDNCLCNTYYYEKSLSKLQVFLLFLLFTYVLLC